MRLHPGLVVLALCASQAAFAQKVVVLEFDGDKGGKLHNQVEAAVKKAKVVDLVSLAAWKKAAEKKKLKGAQAMTPSAVARVSSVVTIDAAVEGALGETFFVRILDSQGNELWSKDLPLKKGLISDDHAKKLAKAIAAAAATAGTAKPAEEEPPPPKKPKKPEESTEASEERATGGEDQTEEEERPRRPVGASDAERRRAEEEAEAQAATQASPEPEKDRDLEDESVKKEFRVRPKIVSLTLQGTTTWRSYCSRPGVATCAEYDKLVADKLPTPVGDTVEFSPQVPYAGFSIAAEVFPLSTLAEKMGGFGFGVLANFALGFSLTNVNIQLPTGTTDTQQVVSTDRSWGAQFATRWFFSIGDWKYRGVGHIGIRGGIGGRTFEIDANANVPLPGPDRFFGQLGVDFYFAPVKFVGLAIGGTYYLGPTPGATVILGYGDLNDPTGGAVSNGFALDFSLKGEVIGPLGYELRLRYQSFNDTFFGQGKKWTTPCDPGRCGGADEEKYTQLYWGLTAAF